MATSCSTSTASLNSNRFRVSPLRVVLPVALLVLSFASLQPQTADACSVPRGGCTADSCNSLPYVNTLGTDPLGVINQANHTYSVQLAFYQGLWNSGKWGSQSLWQNAKGGPFLNKENFREIGFLLPNGRGKSKALTLKDCCNACRTTPGCLMYHFFQKWSSTVSTNKMSQWPDWDGVTRCFLINGGSEIPSDVNSPAKATGVPFSGTHSDQIAVANVYDLSYVGGFCNPCVTDDPHFVGAAGTRFDFNGQIDRSFCLITDERFHVNMMMGGYEAATAGAATAKLKTWIREVGITWKAADGSSHKLQLVARKGKENSRGADGFLARLAIDGVQLTSPKEVGESVEGEGEGAATLTLMEQGRKGPYDMDTYRLVIPGLAEVSLRMRVAHPLLQTADEAYAHFNLHFDSVEVTPRVHGVLGQTFRGTLEQRRKATEYSMLTKLMRGPVAADGESGEGFLDGKMEDYVTSDVLATDCSFSAFAA